MVSTAAFLTVQFCTMRTMVCTIAKKPLSLKKTFLYSRKMVFSIVQQTQKLLCVQINYLEVATNVHRKVALMKKSCKKRKAKL
jgi:hypothetical protein